MVIKTKYLIILFFISYFLFSISSCSRLGYGVLLWSIDDPVIPSGTILPVYIRSNIEQLWVIGVPGTNEKIEIPLSQLEFSGSKRKAKRMARNFSEYASVYAESLQDGLPIRENPDNIAKRVYRLRLGETIKILEKVKGNPPIGTTGEPLEGDWFLVLTRDGVRGYCFSYRLKLFDFDDNRVIASPVLRRESETDPDLENIISKTWVPEMYQQMIEGRRLNIGELEKRYHFDPGFNTGVARINHPDIQRDFRFERIIRDGDRVWFFDGSSLQMTMRSNSSLAVQFLDNTGTTRIINFVSITGDIDDLIEQETLRREEQYLSLFDHGPVFTSNNYGSIILTEEGDFTWTGYDLLVPNYIPPESSGSGKILLDVFITSLFSDRYTGALHFIFTDVEPERSLFFLYITDNEGLRLEIVPGFGIDEDTITTRDPNPFILYFYKDTYPEQ